MANTAVGEAAIYHDGAEYLLRPSFYAMQQIGTPEQIAQASSDVFYALHKLLTGEPLAWYELSACAAVVQSCAADGLPETLTGYPDAIGGDMYWHRGAMDAAELCSIAHQMISYGINGKPDKDRIALAARRAAEDKPKDKPFDPLEFVGAAIAHLGLPTADAWRLTMVEFQRATDAKYPLDKKHKIDMTKAELDAFMAL